MPEYRNKTLSAGGGECKHTFKDKFRLIEKISDAIYGSVHISQHRELHHKRAVKILDKAALKYRQKYNPSASSASMARSRRAGYAGITEDGTKEIELLNYFRDSAPHQSLLSASTHDEQFEDMRKIYVTMPFADGGDAYTYIKNLRSRGEKLQERQTKNWFLQLLSGVNHMHKCGYAHRDLSLENILLINQDDHEYKDDINISSFRLLISDYGQAVNLADSLDDTIDDIVDTIGRRNSAPLSSPRVSLNHWECPGKPGYVAPEVVEINTQNARHRARVYNNRGRYSSEPSLTHAAAGRGSRITMSNSYDPVKADIYSLGVILFTILTGGMPPYNSINDAYYNIIQRGFSKIKKMVSTWGVSISDDAIHLCAMMLRADPNERYNVEEILEHPWLAECLSSDDEEERKLVNSIFITPASSASSSCWDDDHAITPGAELFRPVTEVTEEGDEERKETSTPGLLLINDTTNTAKGPSSSNGFIASVTLVEGSPTGSRNSYGGSRGVVHREAAERPSIAWVLDNTNDENTATNNRATYSPTSSCGSLEETLLLTP